LLFPASRGLLYSLSYGHFIFKTSSISSSQPSDWPSDFSHKILCHCSVPVWKTKLISSSQTQLISSIYSIICQFNSPLLYHMIYSQTWRLDHGYLWEENYSVPIYLFPENLASVLTQSTPHISHPNSCKSGVSSKISHITLYTYQNSTSMPHLNKPGRDWILILLCKCLFPRKHSWE
jgi:hypothetical protein